MALTCPVCRFDNPAEETVVCERCGFNFMADADGGYARALKMLKDTGDSLSSSVGSIGKEKLEDIWEHISSQIRDAISLSRDEFSGVVQKFSGLSAEALDELPEGDAWKNYIAGFSSFQNQMDEGLKMAYEALSNMRDINNLKTGKGQLDLAVSQIQQACESMQSYSASLMLSNMPQRPSIDISLTMSNLNGAVENMGHYINSNDIAFLSEALPFIERAAENLRFILTGNEGESGEYMEEYTEDPAGIQEEYNA